MVSERSRFLIGSTVAAVIVLAAVGLGLLAGGSNGSGDAEPVAADDRNDSTPAAPPALEFVEFEDADALLAAHAGRPLVVNFFASWCPPCRAELPDFAAAHAVYGDRVAFVGVDFQETSVEAAARLLAETGITFDIAEDATGELYGDLGGIGAMPTTIFIDADGRVAERRHGIILAEQLTSQIEALLE